VGPDAGQRHPEQTVGGPQLHPASPTLSVEDEQLMAEGEQFGFEGGALANGVADGDEKSEEDGSHAVECGATINRRKTLDD
jgi:hypothetical protein